MLVYFMYNGRKIHILSAYKPKIGHFEIIAEFRVVAFFTVAFLHCCVYNFSSIK